MLKNCKSKVEKGYARKVFLMHEWSLSLNCFSFKICLSFVFSNVEKGVSIVEKDMYAKMFWMHEWKEGLETKILGFYSSKGVWLNGDFFVSVCVLFWTSHTHFEARK